MLAVVAGRWLLLPALANSGAVRERVEASLEAALGRDVRYDELGIGLVPPAAVLRR